MRDDIAHLAQGRLVPGRTVESGETRYTTHILKPVFIIQPPAASIAVGKVSECRNEAAARNSTSLDRSSKE
jgi:hypothetical protein